MLEPLSCLAILSLIAVLCGALVRYLPGKKYPKKKANQETGAKDLSSTSLPLPIKVYNSCAKIFRRTPLTLIKLLKKAEKRTGLSDYGDETKYPFREGLLKLLQDVNDPRVPLTAFGRICIKEEFIRYLSNHLQIQDLIKRHPEILSEEIKNPVFIIGPPRTATSHLNNTLAQHSSFRTPKYFEMQYPVMPSLDTIPETYKKDPRFIKCQEYLRFFDYLRPYTHLMHDVGVDMNEEDVLLTSIAFRSYVFAVMFPCKEYMKWFGEADHTAAYEYLQLTLQVLQWQDLKCGQERRRWLIKSPEHSSSLMSLKQVFPDATIIQTHRNMSEVLPSFLNFTWYLNQIFCDKNDLKWMGEWWTAWFEFSLNRFVRDQGKLGDRVYNVIFDDFAKDNIGTILSVLEFLHEVLTPEEQERIEDYVKKNSRHSKGRILYEGSLFGLKKQDIRERFKRYHLHFGIESSE